MKIISLKILASIYLFYYCFLFSASASIMPQGSYILSCKEVGSIDDVPSYLLEIGKEKNTLKVGLDDPECLAVVDSLNIEDLGVKSDVEGSSKDANSEDLEREKKEHYIINAKYSIYEKNENIYELKCKCVLVLISCDGYIFGVLNEGTSLRNIEANIYSVAMDNPDKQLKNKKSDRSENK